MLGLGALLKTSATIFIIFKFAGAFYLLYLGIKHWRNKQSTFLEGDVNSVKQLKNNSQLFFQGILMAITNPKAILFFFGLFPQFITQKESVFQQFVVLTITFSVCSLISHLVYLILLSHIKRWFSNLKRIKLFNRTVGAIFIFFGLGLLSLRRI